MSTDVLSTDRCFEILGDRYCVHGTREGLFFLAADNGYRPFAGWGGLDIQNPRAFLVVNGVTLGVDGGSFPWCNTAEDAAKAGELLERLSKKQFAQPDRVYRICGRGVGVEPSPNPDYFNTTYHVKWDEVFGSLGLKKPRKFFKSAGVDCIMGWSGGWFYGSLNDVHKVLRVLEAISTEFYKEESK